jgi:hypothetical protein
VLLQVPLVERLDKNARRTGEVGTSDTTDIACRRPIEWNIAC